jgi:hypothetical protein
LVCSQILNGAFDAIVKVHENKETSVSRFWCIQISPAAIRQVAFKIPEIAQT